MYLSMESLNSVSVCSWVMLFFFASASTNFCLNISLWLSMSWLRDAIFKDGNRHRDIIMFLKLEFSCERSVTFRAKTLFTYRVRYNEIIRKGWCIRMDFLRKPSVEIYEPQQ